MPEPTNEIAAEAGRGTTRELWLALSEFERVVSYLSTELSEPVWRDVWRRWLDLRCAAAGVWVSRDEHLSVHRMWNEDVARLLATRRVASCAGDLWNELENLREHWEHTDQAPAIQQLIDDYEKAAGVGQ